MNKRKLQEVINRLNDSIEAKQNNMNLGIFSDFLTKDFYEGAIYGIKEAISKLEILSKEMGGNK